MLPFREREREVFQDRWLICLHVYTVIKCQMHVLYNFNLHPVVSRRTRTVWIEGLPAPGPDCREMRKSRRRCGVVEWSEAVGAATRQALTLSPSSESVAFNICIFPEPRIVNAVQSSCPDPSTHSPMTHLHHKQAICSPPTPTVCSSLRFGCSQQQSV